MTMTDKLSRAATTQADRFAAVLAEAQRITPFGQGGESNDYINGWKDVLEFISRAYLDESYKLPPSQPVAPVGADGEVKGTYACPICGLFTPHTHTNPQQLRDLTYELVGKQLWNDQRISLSVHDLRAIYKSLLSTEAQLTPPHPAQPSEQAHIVSGRLEAPTGTPIRPWTEQEKEDLRKAMQEMADSEAQEPTAADWRKAMACDCDSNDCSTLSPEDMQRIERRAREIAQGRKV